MSHDPAEPRISELLAEMTLAEKTNLCHAVGNFASGGCQRLGIPPITMSDGPHGVRTELKPDSWDPIHDADFSCTYLPTGTSLAATWNPELAERFGSVLGAEARHRGKDVILGPGVNIIRTPLCGRNFEYFSEDPLLAGVLGEHVVRGIQSQGVAACVKHYALNNQELDRMHVDVEVDDLALHEIYLPAFRRAIIDGGAWTAMGAYNRYQGQHCCHNERLVNAILKGQWAWDGAFISDWGGTHDTKQAAEFGLDIEMGGQHGPDYQHGYLGQPLLKAVRARQVDPMHVEAKARRILRLMFRVGLLGDTPQQTGQRNTPEHRQTALDIARQAVVLLKNDGDRLPLDPARIQRLAVVGANATVRHHGGGGSSGVPAAYEVTPLEGIQALLGDNVEIRHLAGYPRTRFAHPPIPAEHLGIAEEGSGVHGWRAHYYDNLRFQGSPVATRTVANPELRWDANTKPADIEGDFSVIFQARMTAPAAGEYEFAVEGPDCTILKMDDRPLAVLFGHEGSRPYATKVPLQAGQVVELELHVNPKTDAGTFRFGMLSPGETIEQDADDLDTARELAAWADAVVYVGGLTHFDDCEGSDRTSYALPGGQDELIEALLDADTPVVLTFVAGSACAMPWADRAEAIVWMGYNGMEAGTALAEVLFGKTNPSGRLPYTIYRKLSDVPAHSLPDAYRPGRVVYAEGLLVGYRHCDARDVAPLFAFGHGLSYTRFEWTGLRVSPGDDEQRWDIEVDLANAGQRPGAETLQAYVAGPHDSRERPPRELKAFSKLHLAPGQSGTARVTLRRADLARFDPASGEWYTAPGQYELHVGPSSRDLRLHALLGEIGPR